MSKRFAQGHKMALVSYKLNLLRQSDNLRLSHHAKFLNKSEKNLSSCHMITSIVYLQFLPIVIHLYSKKANNAFQ